MALTIGFTFAPILDGLKKGQTSALLLLGVVGFLYCIKNRKWWLAGFSLSLLAVKPHVLFLYFLAVALWAIDQKQWKIILGYILAIIATTSIALVINPDVIQQYILAIRTYPPADWATPTIGGFFRLLFGTEKFWLQFIPPLIGIIWLIYYWQRNRITWNWFNRTCGF